MSKRNGNGAHALKLDPHNARKHPDRNKAQIAASLKELGAGRSILVDATDTIIAGNGVYEQAQALGYKVKVIEADGKTLIAVKRPDLKGAKARRMALADNRATETSEWDVDVLADLAANDADALAGLFDERELRDLLGDKMPGGKEETADAGELVDKAAELQAKWGVERGEVWTVGRHRVMCGDSTNAADVATLMGGERADCVFTSPPYAVGVDYGTYQDTIENLRAMLPKQSKIWLDVVCDGGFAVINFGDVVPAHNITKVNDPCEYPMALEYYPVFRADGWFLWSRRVGVKPIFATHSPWSASSNRAASNWEHIWTWKKAGKSIVGHNSESASGVWGYKGQEVAETKETHGAGMGTDWARLGILAHSRDGAVIYEPFCGSGTTLVACEQTGRIGRGMEIEPKYVAVTLERLTTLGLEAKRVTDTNGNGKTKTTA